MDHIRKSDLPEITMLGRTARAAFGANGYIKTDDAFMGYATFSPKYGIMESHYHENETMYVVDAKGASVRFGANRDNMNLSQKLNPGDIIRARNGEWHRFDFEDENSYLDIVAFFAVPQAHTVNESDIK